MWTDAYASRAVTALAVVLLAVTGLSACGGGPSPSAIRVGDTSIGIRTVQHWTSIITRGALVANLTGSQQPTARQQALTFLIGSAWLEGEAARDGMKPTREQVAHLVEEQRDLDPNGPAGFKATLAETAQTLEDVEAEARARLAAGRLARRLAVAVDRYARARVGEREVTGFYRAHIARYQLRERRYYDLYEQIPTRAQAVALARKLASGARIAQNPNKESPFRPRDFRNLPGQAIAYRAVFAARETNVIVGPLPLQGQWCLFILRRIVPARLQPLSDVRKSIERQLRAPLQRSERTRLIAAYARRWGAQTDCRPGYVVQKCRQFKGPRRSEPEPFGGF